MFIVFLAWHSLRTGTMSVSFSTISLLLTIVSCFSKSMRQQHQGHLGACQKSRISGPPQTHQIRICILTRSQVICMHSGFEQPNLGISLQSVVVICKLSAFQKSTEITYLSWARSTSSFSALSQNSSNSAWLSKPLLFDNYVCLWFVFFKVARWGALGDEMIITE